MRIVFMGTPDFARDSLEALHNSDNEIIAVVTNPDKPKGRGMKQIASPVKEFAEGKKLKLYQPIKVRGNNEFLEEMKDLKPDLFCVVAYGKILPKEILEVPKYGSINVHGSLLPKYRGAAPIQWAVLNGDKETGITTMFMDEGMDTGEMILKEKVSIGDNETTGELWDRLSKIGAKLLASTVQKIDEITKNNKQINLQELKKLIGAEKQGEDFSAAPMLNKEMAKIDWNKPAVEIKNLVRGLNPIMGAYTYLGEKKIKIWKVEIEPIIEEIKTKQNGEIISANLKEGLKIKTKDGIVSVTEIQGENSKKMDIKSFLNGNQISAGSILR